MNEAILPYSSFTVIKKWQTLLNLYIGFAFLCIELFILSFVKLIYLNFLELTMKIKRMKNILSISTMCTVLAFSGLASTNVFADDSSTEVSQPHKKHKQMKKMGKMLGLTDEQKTQLKALKTQAKEQNASLRDSMKQFHDAEKLLLQATTFDEHAYNALYASYQDTFAQAALAKAKSKQAFMSVLTPEQQEKLKTSMEKRKGKSKRRGKSQENLTL